MLPAASRRPSKPISRKVIKTTRALAWAGALACALPLVARADAPAAVVARAQSRAEGNDRAQAVALGEALLATQWPAQILKVRVDAALGHRVAGVVLSGVKFHEPLDEAAFLREVEAIVRRAFAQAPVEEVDLWTTVPLDAGKGAIVSGDLARPTARAVFTVTVRRPDLPRLDAVLRSGDVFWDETWRASLRGRAP